MRILIVAHNFEIGGVQKALVNLLRHIAGRYDVTLALLNPEGPFRERVPENVRLVQGSPMLRYLAMSQGRARKGSIVQWLARSSLAVLAKLLGTWAPVRLCLASQTHLGKYDVAMAFMHGPRRGTLAGGVQEMVLRKSSAPRKIAFVHGDFENGDIATRPNLQLMKKFDFIAAVSESVRGSISRVDPELGQRAIVIRNVVDEPSLHLRAREATIPLPNGPIHLLTVARLGPEKGIQRAIRAVSALREDGHDLNYHLVGDGILYRQIRELIRDLGMEHAIHMHGPLENPYPYFLSSHALLVPSLHEAAPLVIDEALSLGLPIVATKTLSAKEMISKDAGIVCDNSEEGIAEGIEALIRNLNAQTFDISPGTGTLDYRALEQFEQALRMPSSTGATRSRGEESR